MSKQLPSRPNLKHLRNQAKQLLDAQKSGDDDACTRFKTHLPRLSEASAPQVSGANLTLRDAQLVIAREYDFASWSKLKRHLEDHAVIQTPDGSHKELLQRVAGLVGDRTDDTIKTVRRMLGNTDQVAILMIALGQETTAELMKHFSDTEIEHIAQSISNLNTVTTEQEDEVLESFEQLLIAGKYVSQGGLDYARGALEKAVGERKAKAILKRLNAHLDAILKRVTKLIDERPEDAARLLAQQDDTQATLLTYTLGEKIVESIRVHLPNGLPEPASTDNTPIEDKTEALEDFERLLVTLKYVTTGGKQFATGALAKSFGLKKAQKLIERVTPVSGFLQLQALETEQAAEIIIEEDPETVASILAQLDPPQSICIFHTLTRRIQDQVSAHLANGYTLETEDYDTLDQRISDLIKNTQ